MPTTKIPAISAALLMAFALSACESSTGIMAKLASPKAEQSAPEDPAIAPTERLTVTNASMSPLDTILASAEKSGEHQTFATAVKAAGLSAMLDSKGPYTVFAPTDAAFDRLPDGSVATLLNTENKDALTKVLGCHIMSTRALAGSIVTLTVQEGGEHQLPTVGGCEYTATYAAGTLTVIDDYGRTADITVANIQQSNGLIHVINNVLLPSN